MTLSDVLCKGQRNSVPNSVQYVAEVLRMSRLVDERGNRIGAERPIRVPWGAWDLHTRAWIPNYNLSMSIDEQHRQNVANGFSDERGIYISQ